MTPRFSNMQSLLGEIYKSTHKNSDQIYRSARDRSGQIYQSARKQSGEIYQNARKHPGLTIGSAATAVAAAGLGIGLSAGSSPSASTASPPAAVHAADQAHQVASAATHAPTGRTHAAPSSVPASAKHSTTITVRASGTREHARASGAHSASASHRAGSAHGASASRAAGSKAAHAARRAAKPAKPYLIYDSVTPTAIPAHHEVATYATGPFAVPAAQVAHRHVMWIDTNGTDPHAGALDIEPGDATPPVAASWTRAKLSADHNTVAVLYTMQSEWPSVKAAIGQLPSWMQHHVRWWIADPTGYPHVVPGANATQWYWGHSYDITTAKPGFQTAP